MYWVIFACSILHGHLKNNTKDSKALLKKIISSAVCKKTKNQAIKS
jgi:hypothetical protein